MKKIPLEIKMMLAALFPDHVAVVDAPPNALEIAEASFDTKKLLDYLRGGDKDIALPADTIHEDHIPLEEIAKGVYAGMSQKTKVVFLRVVE